MIWLFWLLKLVNAYTSLNERAHKNLNSNLGNNKKFCSKRFLLKNELLNSNGKLFFQLFKAHHRAHYISCHWIFVLNNFNNHAYVYASIFKNNYAGWMFYCVLGVTSLMPSLCIYVVWWALFRFQSPPYADITFDVYSVNVMCFKTIYIFFNMDL